MPIYLYFAILSVYYLCDFFTAFAIVLLNCYARCSIFFFSFIIHLLSMATNRDSSEQVVRLSQLCPSRSSSFFSTVVNLEFSSINGYVHRRVLIVTKRSVLSSARSKFQKTEFIIIVGPSLN